MKPTLVILALFVIAAEAHASSCPTTNVVASPVTFVWSYNTSDDYYYGTLEMGEASFTINGESLTTRAYRQAGGQYSIPGPTLVMEPGKKYVLRFNNTLPYEEASGEHNVFKDPNVTNLHTHGVHISGESPGDDVTRAFEGGFGGDYVYDIPENHMGGSYWYHAHHHGSTFLQVSSGAFGLIIIDDAGDGIPAHVAAMQEQHLLLGYLEPGNAAGTGGDSLISGTFSAGWTANGTVNGAVCLPPDTWQHWRMLVADQDARLVDLEIGDGCEVALMARDGVWRTEVPRLIGDNKVTLTGASRADLAVRCSSDSTISVGGSQVANIYVDGATDPAPHPFAADGVSTWGLERPYYLRDLRQEQFVADSETIRMGARSVLGRKFDAEIPNLIKDANGVQEWSINGATNHPFHLHIYHVQAQSDCGPYEGGEYYDVIAGNCDVRFEMGPEEAFEGRTILHCHILQHEDQGAMGWMQVIGGRAPPTFPGDGEFSEHYPLGGVSPPVAPGGLTANAVSSSQIDLSWSDNSLDETGFDIERSLNGIDFAWIDSVGENVTGYLDEGLNPSTTYYYRAAATNAGGSSGYSNVASDTTQPQTGGTSLEVGSIVVSTVNVGRGEKRGRADIVVVDDQGNLIAGALVSGWYTGDITQEIIEAQTGIDGSVTDETSETAKPLNNLTVCVTDIVDGVEGRNLQSFSGSVCGSL